LAMTTFCWLPPLMVAAPMSRALVLTSSRPAHGPAALLSPRPVSRPGRGQPAPDDARDVAATEASVTRPLLAPVLGDERHARRGSLPGGRSARTGRPGSVTVPVS
jgi:hypothetical protein